jgi:hypothetical protein
MVKNGVYSFFGVWGSFWGACTVSFHNHASAFQAGQARPQRVMGKPCFPQHLPEPYDLASLKTAKICLSNKLKLDAKWQKKNKNQFRPI